MTATIDPAVLHEVALTEGEYARIVELLGREPNHVELGIFGAMWSEHCSYKTSKPLLRNFPTAGPGVLQGPGENAGAVDVGDGWAVVFKIESHNHPSAIEPHAGAATGVGGILRDVFTMGAFPIAALNSLRFGPLDQARNRHLFNGVVAGIGDYGNCFGVPTVGGEIYFEDCYTENPVVNAMAVGLIRKDRLTRARAEGEGNLVMLVGADTGRDGIHGATFASVELDAGSEARRPAVQVGNPFLEKLLMEACMQLIDKDLVVGMQDLGAAGLTSSARPPTMPNTWCRGCSGQTLTHDPHPMQRAGSTTGCREGGSARPASRALSRAAALRLSSSERRLRYQPSSSSDGRP